MTPEGMVIHTLIARNEGVSHEYVYKAPFLFLCLPDAQRMVLTKQHG
jgi:hypothetical protein